MCEFCIILNVDLYQEDVTYSDSIWYSRKSSFSIRFPVINHSKSICSYKDSSIGKSKSYRKEIGVKCLKKR